MTRAALLFLICAALTAPGLASAKSARPVAARAPVVVELFTAQGCSSCGKANTFDGALVERPGVIALTWPVDYWDYLGWKDTFAQPEFTDRQRAYDHHFGLRDVYTPQVVVDGTAQASGAKSEDVEALIKAARRAPARPLQVRLLRGGKVAIGSGRLPPGGGEVWLIRYDPREQDVEVKDGDNRGHTVPHRNVVRQLVRLGAWRGHTTQFKLPAASDEGLETLVLVQGVKGGRILGVLKAPKG